LCDKSTQDLITDFIAITPESANYELTERGRTLWEQLQAIAKELIRRGAQAELLALTENPNVAVKFYAAELCFDVAPEVTRRVFEAVLADDSAGFFQHRAKIGLMIRFVDFLEANRRPWSAKEKEILEPFFALLAEIQPKLDKSSQK
jgi:hypothetical protein